MGNYQNHRMKTVLATLLGTGMIGLLVAYMIHGKMPATSVSPTKPVVIDEPERHRTIDEVCNAVDEQQNPILFARCRQRVAGSGSAKTTEGRKPRR